MREKTFSKLVKENYKLKYKLMYFKNEYGEEFIELIDKNNPDKRVCFSFEKFAELDQQTAMEIEKNILHFNK